MELEMVLNELSLRSPAPNIQIACQWMTQFTSTIRSATRQGVSRVLRTDADFQTTRLAPDYALAQWRNDGAVSREERQFLRVLTTKAPYLEGLSSIQDTAFGAEFRYHHKNHFQPAVGLGYAYLLEGLAISFPTARRWRKPVIELEYSWLDDNSDLSSEQIEVKHCSHPDHTLLHRDWITNRLQTGVRDGVDLWDRRATLFPSLIFCESAKTNIHELGSGDRKLRQVVKRLFEFETYCLSWREGGFEPEAIGCKTSPESQATLNQYSEERTFLCPDGQNRLFSWHARLTPDAWRVHFYPNTLSHTIIIGYVGPHLRTATDPT